MNTVTDRLSNPFGMRADCDTTCSEAVDAVYGYGDPNADVHLIGDHPGRHGGRQTGIPFTGTPASRRLREVLSEVGLLEDVDHPPPVCNLFMSYLHLCCPQEGSTPSDGDYGDLERFFDAEMRAITADVLLPVGERATSHVLEYFSAVPIGTVDIDDLHAGEIAGRGFLIMPIRDPADWTEPDEQVLTTALSTLLASDYTRAADLTRFSPTDEPYLVR